MRLKMADEKDSPVLVVVGGGQSDEGPGSQQPMHMQLFSTWEVRKAPVNCVPRLCTLQVTRLEVTRPLEVGLGSSIVLAASMKTPHRFLRSNEIIVPPSGVLTIPLELTFSLQYPHFLKRGGGNVLQIRLQRRKRVRNRVLGGYKNLAIGLVEMSHILQHSFQGEVKLHSEKIPEHMAVVTVGSLTSTAVALDRREHLVEEASSEEDDEDIFSDDHIGSDTESGDNEQQRYQSKNKFKPSTTAVLRLLHLNKSSKNRRRHPDDIMMEMEEEEEFHRSSVAFASSPSDTDEEEEEEQGGVLESSLPRPTLSPFFGSDRCSMVSLPTSAKSAESWAKSVSSDLKRYDSLEQAIHKGRMDPTIPFSARKDDITWDLSHGRVWCVADDIPGSQVGQVVVGGLEKDQEVVTRIEGEVDAVHTMLSLVNSVFKQWKAPVPFCVVLVGSDSLVSSSLQALSQSRCPPEKLRFAIIPIAAGLMSTRLSSLDDKYQLAFPSDGKWLSNLQNSTTLLLQYVEDASNSLPLPLAQVVLQSTGDLGGSSFTEQSLPFMCSVSIGNLEVDTDASTTSLTLPTSPNYGGGETPELILEYWGPKGQKEKGSVKVRGVLVSYVDNILNVTATREKKGKGIRIRKSKEADSGGSIVSLTTTQLTCRPTGKADSMVVVVDGVERERVNVVKLQAGWDLTPNRTFSIAVTSGV